jgi:hypothetical protein
LVCTTGHLVAAVGDTVTLVVVSWAAAIFMNNNPNVTTRISTPYLLLILNTSYKKFLKI